MCVARSLGIIKEEKKKAIRKNRKIVNNHHQYVNLCRKYVIFTIVVFLMILFSI
jgi:hypothetical protein